MRRKKPKENTANAGSLMARLRKPPWFYIIVLLGVLSHAVMLNIQIVTGIESEKWLQTEGSIITSRVVEHDKGESGRAKTSFTRLPLSIATG